METAPVVDMIDISEEEQDEEDGAISVTSMISALLSQVHLSTSSQQWMLVKRAVEPQTARWRLSLLP